MYTSLNEGTRRVDNVAEECVAGILAVSSASLAW